MAAIKKTRYVIYGDFLKKPFVKLTAQVIHDSIGCYIRVTGETAADWEGFSEVQTHQLNSLSEFSDYTCHVDKYTAESQYIFGILQEKVATDMYLNTSESVDCLEYLTHDNIPADFYDM